ncbi:MACPF domain-containing protein CAD1-like isoform X2 [Ananas comosus]|uniref:MACPF domain-containing protein CAD1-like isoform X2 n=1 Tax=Ananas comosus TaxID=4615 RepID=A0A6P5G1N4_ANACO|nr:MACPF domain-containing protein CAD1-like isoform X2 [Ananas comosus]
MRMEENAALHTIQSSIQALGRGFDVNHDTRLLYCKGIAGSRLIEVDAHARDLAVFDGVVVPNVSRDVKCSYDSGGREGTGACSFYEMAEYFNRKANLSGNIPLGCFNSAFSFTGLKKTDAASTKSLAMDGKFIPLCKVQIIKQSLTLKEEVRRAVPLSWDPSSLSRFIENYGTHIITSITIGGKDVIYVKQHSSSPLSAMEIKNYVQDLGEQRFSESESHTSSGPMKVKDKAVDPFVFNSQGVYPQPPNTPYLTAKEDVTVIFRRRGGDDLIQSHTHWARTIRSAPDVIDMTFFPITSLLERVPGKDHLIRAINLYLEYKPPVEELRYFLEFQVPRIWAPVQDGLRGQRRKEPVCPSLQFSIMGKKLYISQEQVTVGRKPVTGLRLCLEGPKQNRLCIQVQHLSTLPKIFQPYWDAHVAIGAPKWQGPEEQDSRWFEPVKWKNFSHVSTAPVEYHESFIGNTSGVYVVTGAQLGVWDFGAKNVLYMKLLYSKVPGCTIRRSLWDHSPTAAAATPTITLDDKPESGDSSSSSSSADAGRLLKFVDMSEMYKGPDDIPGHWLVTGGKLGVEKGKVVLRVKYSLLNY